MYYKDCECGGEFRDSEDMSYALMCDPPKLRFTCNKCGKQELLTKGEWPEVRYKELD